MFSFSSVFLYEKVFWFCVEQLPFLFSLGKVLFLCGIVFLSGRMFYLSVRMFDWFVKMFY